jgi:hypothetical protein
MAVIFVFGPCWNNLETLKNTIENNKRMISNIKKIYITTNDNNVLNYYKNLNDENILCQKFADNQGHQTSCFNAIISGMKMVIDNEKDNDDDIVIFAHEDVYINDIRLFNNSLSKFNKGVDIVCRKYAGTQKGESLDYYMNDAFFIKKNKIKEIFGNANMMIIHIGMFCENEFTKIINKYNIFSIPYHSHSTHKDSELGFHHILNYNIGNIPFWDKSNINEILNM